MNDYDIVKLISSMRRIDISDDFTSRVMSRVLSERTAVIRQINLSVFIDNEWLDRLSGFIARPKTIADCAICYGLTGVFYLVLGIVLIVGLKALATDVLVNQGIRMLPWLSLFVAAWLLLLALMIVSGSRKAVKGAKTGTVFLIAVVMVGISVFSRFASSPALYLSMAMSVTAVFMGLLLYYHLSALLPRKNGTRDRELTA